MKKFLVMMVAGMLVLGIGAMTFADALAFNPVSILSELTKKTEAEIQALAKDKSFGAIAADAGVLKAYQDAQLAAKKALVAERVKAGTLTQAQADAWLAKVEAQMATCDGTGENQQKLGMNMGMRFGGGQGKGAGQGQGQGFGAKQGGRQGQGQGQGLRNGSCGLGL